MDSIGELNFENVEKARKMRGFGEKRKMVAEQLCKQKYPPYLSQIFVDKSVDIVDNFT